MSQFVVDASVAVIWCFPDEDADLADRVADMLRRGDSAMVPAFWPHEVLNALLVGEKRGRISAELIRTFLAGILALRIILEPSSASTAFDRLQTISRKYGLTAYDAAYLDLAQANRLPLATLDKDLIRACEKAGVALL